jgi:hypothetical protein
MFLKTVSFSGSFVISLFVFRINPRAKEISKLLLCCSIVICYILADLSLFFVVLAHSILTT